MAIQVDQVLFWHAEEGPAVLRNLQVDNKATKPSLNGHDIRGPQDLIKIVQVAYTNDKLTFEDLLIWDNRASAWVEVTLDSKLSTFVVLFGSQKVKSLSVGLRPSKKDGLEVEIYQSGIDYIQGECVHLKQLVACALNSIRSDAVRFGRSVSAHFQHYTAPAFKLRAGFNLDKLDDLNFNLVPEKVSVVHRYGSVAFQTLGNSPSAQERMKGGFEAKLNPAVFEASSDKNPYPIKCLRELGNGEKNQTYRRDERRLLVIAVQSNESKPLEHVVKLEFDKAFKKDSGPVFLAFSSLQKLGFSISMLMEMVPSRLRSYLHALLCGVGPDKAEKGCVIVTDGSSDCSWCQIFPASSLDSETVCCVPCVVQHYPDKVKDGLFDDKGVDNIANSGLQEFWHAWAWILRHSKPTGFLNELQLKRLKTRLQVLENNAITCRLMDNLFKPFSKPGEGLRGALLHGPPGTGKTRLLQPFREAGLYELFWGVTANMNSRYVGETEQKLMQLANSASHRPHLLHVFFFDEVETHAKKRTLQEGKESNKGDVLSVLLGIVGRDGVVVLACTNFLHQLDDALCRSGRLDLHIPVLPFNYYQRLRFLHEEIFGLFKMKGLPPPSGWSPNHIMNFTIADLDHLRRRCAIILQDAEEQCISVEANSEIYAEFARAVSEVREVSQREVLLPTPQLDFVGIWICHVFLTLADFLLFDLSTGTIRIGFVAEKELRSVDLVLGPGKLRRSDALAYIANFAAIRRMAMVVTLNGDQTFHNFGLVQQLCLLVLDYESLSGFVKESGSSTQSQTDSTQKGVTDSRSFTTSWNKGRTENQSKTSTDSNTTGTTESSGGAKTQGSSRTNTEGKVKTEGQSDTVGGSVSVSKGTLGFGVSVTGSYSHSWFNSTARSQSTSSGNSSSHTDNWNRSKTQSKTHSNAVTKGTSETETEGLAQAITEALQSSVSNATGVSRGATFRHMRAEALSDVVNTFFRDHMSQFPRAVLTDDVEQCDLPWFERPAVRLDVSCIDRVYGTVKPAELQFLEPEEMKKMVMPTSLLDWQYPAGDTPIPNQQTKPLLSFRMKLGGICEKLRLLDIAFSISDISFKPLEGARYEIEIDFGAHGGKRTLSAQNSKKLPSIKAFSHCRNFVDILAADVKEIEIKFTKKVVVTAVQVLVCAKTGEIDKHLGDEESLLMLR